MLSSYYVATLSCHNLNRGGVMFPTDGRFVNRGFWIRF